MACCFPPCRKLRDRMGHPFRAARREGGPCLRKAKGAPAVRVLRLRYASLRMTTVLGDGVLLSHPVANCASGWGTRFCAAWREGGPCLRKAKDAPAVRVLRLRYAALRMTTVLG